jgi:hypothetical protein
MVAMTVPKMVLLTEKLMDPYLVPMMVKLLELMKVPLKLMVPWSIVYTTQRRDHPSYPVITTNMESNAKVRKRMVM